MMNKIIEYYNSYNEDNRLKSKTHLPEYLITMKYIKKYLTPNSKRGWRKMFTYIKNSDINPTEKKKLSTIKWQ